MDERERTRLVNLLAERTVPTMGRRHHDGHMDPRDRGRLVTLVARTGNPYDGSPRLFIPQTLARFLD
jgi:hypothetical protein